MKVESLADYLEQGAKQNNLALSYPAYLSRLFLLAAKLEPNLPLSKIRKASGSFLLSAKLIPFSLLSAKLLRPRPLLSAKLNSNLAASSLGSRGGQARSERLSPERRREIAMFGVAARQKKRGTK